MASGWKGKKHTDHQHTERQVCVDALYGFVEDNLISSDLQYDWRLFMVELCQRSIIAPRKLTLQREDIRKLPGVVPVENGVSARVFHGQYGGHDIAIKDFHLYSKTVRKVKKSATKEATILCLLRHPNIVPFVGVMERPYEFWLVSEWMKNGDITQYLNTKPNVPKNELLEQVADGLDYLRQYGIVHGDLKGTNILIDKHGKARIADFGSSFVQDFNLVPYVAPAISAKIRARCQNALKAVGLPEAQSNHSVSSTLSSFSGAGTGRWMSPERLEPEFYGKASAKPTLESDVFSFGMLIYQVYSGNKPFHEANNYKAMANIIAGSRPPRPPGATDALWSLTEECWSEEAADRPGVADVYNRLAVMGG